ncbi:MAG: diguanylate cyclase [Chloroflexota bacterium]
MNGDILKVLMIEDDIDFAELTRLFLKQEDILPIQLTVAPTLKVAIQALRSDIFDAVLLDLTLPDSTGLDTFNQIRLNEPNIPIVVLSAQNDVWLAIQSVREGAQDYLLKGAANGAVLSRSIYYAVERQHTMDTLRRLSLLDELTGLYNRRGFLTLAEQHVTLAKRCNYPLTILYADVDHLKQINDKHGHLEGDQILVRAANVLRKTFRRSDIIGRLGGDEYIVLAIDVSPEDIRILLERFEFTIAKDNSIHAVKPYALSISLGSADIDPCSPLSIEDGIQKADKALYQQKHNLAC